MCGVVEAKPMGTCEVTRSIDSGLQGRTIARPGAARNKRLARRARLRPRGLARILGQLEPGMLFEPACGAGTISR